MQLGSEFSPLPAWATREVEQASFIASCSEDEDLPTVQLHRDSIPVCDPGSAATHAQGLRTILKRTVARPSQARPPQCTLPVSGNPHVPDWPPGNPPFRAPPPLDTHTNKLCTMNECGWGLS
ncbi:hypothetical protein VTN00DRAFT_6743 [Thermoascus crustaceus]|uniref:uncharacterized protein n=1 Tax=Thermoascus crustaceus TaxID=5088 RepID=UPI00374261CD